MICFITTKIINFTRGFFSDGFINGRKAGLVIIFVKLFLVTFILYNFMKFVL